MPETGTPEWRKRIAELMKEETTQPEMYWWLSFCDPDKPAGSQFLGAIIVKAHGMTDALTKCNTMMINPGGEVQGVAIPEEANYLIKPEDVNKLLSKEYIQKNMGGAVSMNDGSPA